MNIPAVVKSNGFFDDCKLGKMHQKSFIFVPHYTTAPLELVHMDVWGPASVYRYYLVIVDDFKRHAWLFPLVLKSDVASIIPSFVLKVERQFNTKVKIFQSDIGG